MAETAGDADQHSVAARGHPPGPVLVLWTLHRLGLSNRLWLGVLVTAVGALLTPLVIAAVASVCGELALPFDFVTQCYLGLETLNPNEACTPS